VNARQRRRSLGFIYMNGVRRRASDPVQRRNGMVASGSVMNRSNRSTGSPQANPRKAIPMFRKVAIALIAASMLTAPVMAQTPAPTAKPTAAVSSTTVKAVKASKTVKATKTVKYHARVHRGTHVAGHKHMNGVKHARHLDAGKGHKVAGTANKVVSAKPATRSGTN
jgi:hypothetical protein